MKLVVGITSKQKRGILLLNIKKRNNFTRIKNPNKIKDMNKEQIVGYNQALQDVLNLITKE